MTKSDLSLGFVGLGALGLPMAINLHRAGFKLRVHSRSRTAETSPELEGAVRCSSPADASTGVDVLLLCVSDDAAVEDVLFDPNGAASQLSADSVVLDCSTNAPPRPNAVRSAWSQNVHYLDAPVTGGTEGAKRGSLTVLVGEPASLERVRPILEVIGGPSTTSERGAGQQVKAVNQVLVAGSYAAVAEAVASRPAFGAAHAQVIDALKMVQRLMGPRPSQHRHAGGQLSPRLPARACIAGSRSSMQPRPSSWICPSQRWWNSWNWI